MIKGLWTSLLFLTLALLTGCVNAPPRIDHFAGLSVNNTAYKGLSVALLLTENTKNALNFTADMSARDADPVGKNIFQDYRGSMGERADKIFPAVVELFKRDFKSVVRIDRMEDAAAVHTDAVAVLDIYLGLPTVKVLPFPGMTDAKTDIGVVFMAVDGTRIDAVSASAARTPGYPRTSRNINNAVDQSREEALSRFESAVFASAKLLEFTKATVNGTSAVAALSTVKSDVDDLPAIKATPNKKAYAIVIGIENYRQKLPKADFATHDAETVAQYLTKVMGYPEENVVTLLNDHASNVDFAKYFEKWLPNNVEKDSSVFVYYSGHGAPNTKTGDAFLVPYDGDPAFIDQTGYSLKRLYDSLGKLQAKEIIVALDSCFSGAGGRSVIAKGSRPLVMSMDNLIIPSKIAVLSASSGEQTSSTYEEKGHGLFTYFLLKGIKGGDDTNKNGTLEIRELFNYIKPQVERIARKVYNNEQSPQMTAPKENRKIFLMENGR